MCCLCHNSDMTLDDDSVAKLTQMVNNFDQLCCSAERRDVCRFRNPRTYTDFRVDEIMKDNFGRNGVYSSDYSSDSDSSSVGDYSTAGDWSGSSSGRHGDDVASSNNGFYNSEAATEIHCSCANYASVHIGTDVIDKYDVIPSSYVHQTMDAISRHRCPYANTCHRIQQSPTHLRLLRRFHDNDEYSTDASGSDTDTPLDLRVQRKMTPPKITKVTGQQPAWVYCTRYSDRPSAGPRARRRKPTTSTHYRRSRIAFHHTQLHELNIEFQKSPYVSDERRQELAEKLNLAEGNIRVWFQNRRAKLKKDNTPLPLALQLMAQGLYKHKHFR